MATFPSYCCFSPFISPGSVSTVNSAAVLHLRRDLLVPTILRLEDEQNEGYDEGKVTNTRFGSFPHTTLIGIPWGTQVRASTVDTGSRGRRGVSGKGKKRKREEGEQAADGGRVEEDAESVEARQKIAVTASTGFGHLLPPTPEIWTASLPHRTQVVYTPDYSYILHRLRARPGSILIEAGAGSGSFTHAAARAVYNGRLGDADTDDIGSARTRTRLRGKVWSFEFHEQRVEKLKMEISEHGLDGIVEITHRDVCQDGFGSGAAGGSNLEANAIFLDLPAPWLALKHLTREIKTISTEQGQMEKINSLQKLKGHREKSSRLQQHMHVESADEPFLDDNGITPNTEKAQSPLDPDTSIYLCTFSPCIEQVQRTITTMRQLGWVNIEMVEIAAKRIEVRRERVGLQEEGLRGVNPSPATIEEALARLREVEGRSRNFHTENSQEGTPSEETSALYAVTPATQVSKQQRLENIREALDARKLYKEGNLVHKAEPELKTHTSYLVFAILPREWTTADEVRAKREWPAKVIIPEKNDGTYLSNRQKKRAAKARAGGNKAFEIKQDDATKL